MISWGMKNNMTIFLVTENDWVKFQEDKLYCLQEYYLYNWVAATGSKIKMKANFSQHYFKI